MLRTFLRQYMMDLRKRNDTNMKRCKQKVGRDRSEESNRKFRASKRSDFVKRQRKLLASMMDAK